MHVHAPSVLMVSQPTVAGVAQCVLDWSVGLQARGWQVRVACPQDGWLAGRLTEAGVAVSQWDSVRNPTSGLRSERRDLRKIVTTTAPDVVFLNSSKAGLVGRLALRGAIPTVFAPHSWSFEAASGATAAAAVRWERLAARWTHRFVCVSEAERNLGLHRRIAGRYIVARNGVDLGVLTAPADRGALRASLGIPAEQTALVCVGRLCEQKGQDVLLDAWPLIDAESRSLTFVGDGPDLDRLCSRTHSPRIRFIGDVERQQAVSWLSAADLVVLPSRWEGMALVPLEALAVGTPVVASDVNGAREAITASVGALCPPGDPSALATAITDWLAAPHDPEQIRQACRDRVLTNFDLRETVGILDRTLRQVRQEVR